MQLNNNILAVLQSRLKSLKNEITPLQRISDEKENISSFRYREWRDTTPEGKQYVKLKEKVQKTENAIQAAITLLKFFNITK